jgi:hypothetical protein
MSEKYKFKGKTCKSCSFYHITEGHVTWNVCVAWQPSSTAINQFAIYPHVDDNFVACAMYEPLEEEQPVDDNPKAKPASEIGEVM